MCAEIVCFVSIRAVCVFVYVCVCVCVCFVCLTNIPIKAEVEWPKLNLEVTFICEMTRKKNYHEQ